MKFSFNALRSIFILSILITAERDCCMKQYVVFCRHCYDCLLKNNRNNQISEFRNKSIDVTLLSKCQTD